MAVQQNYSVIFSWLFIIPHLIWLMCYQIRVVSYEIAG